MVERILELSRVETQGLRADRSEVDVAHLLADLDRETRVLQTQSGLEFEWRVEPGTPSFETDSAKLELALKSVIENAAKFTESGTVEIQARPARGGIELTLWLPVERARQGRDP